MHRFSRHSSRWLVASLIGLLLCGCGTESKKVHVKGRVTRNGEVLRIESPPHVGRVMVNFVPLGEGNQPAGEKQFAVVDPDTGNFRVDGVDGKGIPPGKYRIEVYQYDPFPQKDKLNGAFGEGKSQIIREITSDEEINLDVSKPTG